MHEISSQYAVNLAQLTAQLQDSFTRSKELQEDCNLLKKTLLDMEAIQRDESHRLTQALEASKIVLQEELSRSELSWRDKLIALQSECDVQMARKEEEIVQLKNTYEHSVQQTLVQHQLDIQKVQAAVELNSLKRQQEKMDLYQAQQALLKKHELLEEEHKQCKDKYKSSRIREQKYIKHMEDLSQVVIKLKQAMQTNETTYQGHLKSYQSELSSLKAEIQDLRERAKGIGLTGGTAYNTPSKQESGACDADVTIKIKNIMLEDQNKAMDEMKLEIFELNKQIRYYNEELIPEYSESIDILTAAKDEEVQEMKQEIAVYKELIEDLQSQLSRNKEIEHIYNALINKIHDDV